MLMAESENELQHALYGFNMIIEDIIIYTILPNILKLGHSMESSAEVLRM
jgi:hypothetical protein